MLSFVVPSRPIRLSRKKDILLPADLCLAKPSRRLSPEHLQRLCSKAWFKTAYTKSGKLDMGKERKIRSGLRIFRST